MRRPDHLPTVVSCTALTMVLASALMLTPTTSLGATPSTARPTATVTAGADTSSPIGTGDSRSDGEGPGLVGSPLAIALGVIILGVATAVGTLVVLRIGGGRRG